MSWGRDKQANLIPIDQRDDRIDGLDDRQSFLWSRVTVTEKKGESSFDAGSITIRRDPLENPSYDRSLGGCKRN